MGPPKKTKTAPKKDDAITPDWPPFKPLLPPSDVSLTTLIPSQIMLIRNFFTSKLCNNYVSFLRSLPLTTTPGKPKKGDALRFNDRFQTLDEGFANRLWSETGLKELVCGQEDSSDETAEEGEEIMSAEQRRELWYSPNPSHVRAGLTKRCNRGGEVVGLNPSIRIYRYTKGQYFDCHCRLTLLSQIQS